MIATTDINDRLPLPTSSPTIDRKDWRAKPTLPKEFSSVLGKIKELVGRGLTSMHVLGDYLKRRIAPLQQRPRPCRSYTGSNDCGRVQRGEEFDLTQEGLEVLV